MPSMKGWTWVKIASVIGGMFINMPSGFMWYWGNMSVYTLSYVVIDLDVTASEVETPWVPCLYIVCETVGFFVYGMLLIRVLHRKWILVITMILGEASLLLSYLAVQTSMTMLVVDLGVLFGLSCGLCYPNVFQMLVEQSDGSDLGLMTALFQASFSFGALAINWGLTLYTNRSNETPLITLGSMMFFTQRNVLDKVPSMHLLLGFISLALYLIGFVLVQFNPTVSLCAKSKGENGIVIEDIRDESDENKASSERSYQSLPDENTTEEVNFSPKEMLKTRAFYVLWIGLFTADAAFVLILNFYKSYGQLWIHDDHFLTDTATVLIVVGTLTRFGFGVLMDKIGFKTCVVFISSCNVIVSSFYYFTPMLNRYVFLITTLVYGGCAGSAFNVYMGAVALLYGKRYAYVNVPLLLTANAAFNLLAPFVVRALLANVGWFGLFATSGVLSFVGLALVLVFL